MLNFKLLFSVTLSVVTFGYAHHILDIDKIRSESLHCTVGEIIELYKCNRCECLEKGVMICTDRLICGFKRPETTLSARLPPYKLGISSSNALEDWTPKWKEFFEETASCKVGEQRRDPDDCNWCECTAPGSMNCDTKKKCSKTTQLTLSASSYSGHSKPIFNKSPEYVKQWKKFAENAATCTEGKRTQDPDGCNMCDCLEIGVMVCSRVLCGKKSGMIAPNRKEKNKKSPFSHNLQSLKKLAETAAKCTVGDRMRHYDGCNWCECIKTGIMICSRKRCSSMRTRGSSRVHHGLDAAVVVTVLNSKLYHKNNYSLRDKSKDCIPDGKTINTPCYICKCIHHGVMKCVTVKGSTCDKNKKSKKNPILTLDLPADSDYFAYY